MYVAISLKLSRKSLRKSTYKCKCLLIVSKSTVDNFIEILINIWTFSIYNPIVWKYTCMSVYVCIMYKCLRISICILFGNRQYG